MRRRLDGLGESTLVGFEAFVQHVDVEVRQRSVAVSVVEAVDVAELFCARETRRGLLSMLNVEPPVPWLRPVRVRGEATEDDGRNPVLLGSSRLFHSAHVKPGKGPQQRFGARARSAAVGSVVAGVKVQGIWRAVASTQEHPVD